MGGQTYGRLWSCNDDKRARAARAGITDFERAYSLRDMVTSDMIHAAVCATGGSILRGARRDGAYLETETLLMRSKTGSVRRITYRQKNQ